MLTSSQSLKSPEGIDHTAWPVPLSRSRHSSSWQKYTGFCQPQDRQVRVKWMLRNMYEHSVFMSFYMCAFVHGYEQVFSIIYFTLICPVDVHFHCFFSIRFSTWAANLCSLISFCLLDMLDMSFFYGHPLVGPQVIAFSARKVCRSCWTASLLRRRVLNLWLQNLCWYTIRLFNIAMENHHGYFIGKPSILWAIYTMAM